MLRMFMRRLTLDNPIRGRTAVTLPKPTFVSEVATSVIETCGCGCRISAGFDLDQFGSDQECLSNIETDSLLSRA